MPTTEEIRYGVATIIGGWKQNMIFVGTLEECEEYIETCTGNEFIVSEADYYEPDYLGE